MTDIEYDFYGRFASWWPLISPIEDYEEEAAYLASLLLSQGKSVTRVLELGSGGGSNAFYLKQHFDLTLVDLSKSMLEVSRALNPECSHLCGDMRSLRLGETFDAVFAHDAIDYMKTEQELAAAIETAFVHCRPGGRAIFMPDDVSETYEDSTEHGGSDAPDGRAARYLEWSWDPDPNDDQVCTEYTFLLRDQDGSIVRAHETHHYGLFGTDTWRRLIEEQGFAVDVVVEDTEEDRTPRRVFVAERPERLSQ